MIKILKNLRKDLNGKVILEDINISHLKNEEELTDFTKFWIIPAKTAWDMKAIRASSAVLITVSKSCKKATMKDFIDFTTQYDTKDKIVEKILELGYAKKSGYNIDLIFGDTEASNNVYEIFKQAVKDLSEL